MNLLRGGGKLNGKFAWGSLDFFLMKSCIISQYGFAETSSSRSDYFKVVDKDSQLYAQLTAMHSAWLFFFLVYLFIYKWTNLNDWQWPFLFLAIQQSWWLSTYSFSSNKLKVCALAGLLKMILILMLSRWDSPMFGEESLSCSCPHMSWSKLPRSHSMRH